MEVSLEHKDEFIQALAHYRPSDDAIVTLSTMPLVILLSVTGGGRNTIINRLVETGRYHFIVSDTTRPPKVRNNELEQDGVSYHFRKEEDVLGDIKAGRYLEAELIHGQQVSGTSIQELKRAHDSGKVPINEVDLGGTDAIAAVKPDTLFLFIVPPSFDEWMRRLRTRENMSDEELDNRLTTAVRMLQTVLASNRFVFVVNDNLDEVVSTVDDYISGEQHSFHDQQARQVAEQILAGILQHYPQLASRNI
jgi:guanylate kinase